MRVLQADNYDFPAKRTVRNHWASFAAAGIAPEARSKLIAWFFPGPPALEVSEYLRVGLKMNQLVGFEWNAARAALIRREVPRLLLVDSALRTFLENSKLARSAPDWANLDFDGSALTFAFEVREVLRRLRLDHAPRLGISSLGDRDGFVLPDAVCALSMWSSADTKRFATAIDLRRRSNERAGLIAPEPVATYMLARELAVFMLVVQGLGERVYHDGDADAAQKFVNGYHDLARAIENAIGSDIRKKLARGVSVPIMTPGSYRFLFAERRIPVRLAEVLRFIYQSEGRWRWTWYFRFAASSEPVPLSLWIDKLLFSESLLHVIDFTGAVIGRRAHGACPWCQKEVIP